MSLSDIAIVAVFLAAFLATWLTLAVMCVRQIRVQYSRDSAARALWTVLVIASPIVGPVVWMIWLKVIEHGSKQVTATFHAG